MASTSRPGSKRDGRVIRASVWSWLATERTPQLCLRGRPSSPPNKRSTGSGAGATRRDRTTTGLSRYLINRAQGIEWSVISTCVEGNGAALLKPHHSAKLLHHDPVALNFVQAKLDRCGRLGQCHIGGFDRTEDFALGAQ